LILRKNNFKIIFKQDRHEDCQQDLVT
jgi:hypothetical protein